MSEGRSLAERWQRSRLLRLAALIAVVGFILGGLYAVGVFGRSGSETVTVQDEGEVHAVVIEPARLVETEQPPPLAGLEVGPAIGKVAPDFEFSDAAGNRLRLSDYRGRPVYLNFWATWCSPCRREMPDIQTLQEKHEASGLVVIAMNRGERLEQANAYLKQLDLNFTVEGMDPTQEVYDAYNIFLPPAMPISVFIDKNGVIRGYHPGLATLAQMETLLARTLQ